MALDFNSLLGGIGSVGGMDGNIIQQWQMLRANSAAYRRLLAAEETGTVKQGNQPVELLSDRYFNDNYNPETKELVRPTYKPDDTVTPTVDSKATAGDNLDSMRRIALAAMSSSGSLNPVHYDLFEQLRASIANNLQKTSTPSDSSTSTTTDPAAATLSRDISAFRLLTDEQSFTVAGKAGEVKYTFGVGASWDDVASAINADSDKTGVKAEIVKDESGNPAQLKLTSAGTGKDSFIRVDQTTGSVFAAPGASASAVGADGKTSGSSTAATSDQAKAAMAVGVPGATLDKDQTFTVAGNYGSQQFTFAAGTSVESIVDAINGATTKTGVAAQLIQNANGDITGIGLLSDKGGSGQYVQVAQKDGDLFAAKGQTVKAQGKNTGTNVDGTSINNVYDLGRVDINGKSYSFADLGPGGAASLDKNPDVALAIIDQAMRDIYSGKAKVAGFDISDKDNAVYIPKESDNKNVINNTASNTQILGGLHLDDLKSWLSSYAR